MAASALQHSLHITCTSTATRRTARRTPSDLWHSSLIWPYGPLAGQRGVGATCQALHQDHNGQDDQDYGEVITFLTADGMVRFPSRLSPVRRVLTSRSRVAQQPMPSWEEQLLCPGATFEVAARNERDIRRRINIVGFCQSVDLLFESIEDVVMQRGGEILDEERKLKSGIHEQLKLIVAIPYLWGVPPTLDCLRSAIEVGGGIVDRVYHRWDMY